MNKYSPMWGLLEAKAALEDNTLPIDMQIKNRYLAAVESVCEYGAVLSKTIRDVFPRYTLHDATHIDNVQFHMYNLLGRQGVENIRRDELAMLIMSAYCHDIGMSVADREEIQKSENYIFETGGSIDSDMFADYIRRHHHERVADVLSDFDWPEVLKGHIEKDELINVCRSHGQSIDVLRTPTFDIRSGASFRFCAILLRLADILDFDRTRAPFALYKYSFEKLNKTDENILISESHWQNHISSSGFDTAHMINGEIPYSAECSSPVVEKAVRRYLDWVDEELYGSGHILSNLSNRWSGYNLPYKVNRDNIKAKNYISGDFHFAVNQKQVLRLFSSLNLYNEPYAFIRELYQNAVDAVRTRQIFDMNLPASWEPQISIKAWTEDEYQWIRIDDNGIGMNKYIIENYLLNVGCSYYRSKEFEELLGQSEQPEFKPISRFGVGVLSCFIDDDTKIEISTLHYGSGAHSLRLSIEGLGGSYYLSDKELHHKGRVMPGGDNVYRNEPGTSIAVRVKRMDEEIHFDEMFQYPAVKLQIEYDGKIWCPETQGEIVNRARKYAEEHTDKEFVILDQYSPTGIVSGFINVDNNENEPYKKEDDGTGFDYNKRVVYGKLDYFDERTRITWSIDPERVRGIKYINDGIFIGSSSGTDRPSREHFGTSGVVFINSKAELLTGLSRHYNSNSLPLEAKLLLTVVGRYLLNNGMKGNPFFEAFRIDFPSEEKVYRILEKSQMLGYILIPENGIKGGKSLSDIVRRVYDGKDVEIRLYFGFSHKGMEHDRRLPDMTRIQIAVLKNECEIFDTPYVPGKERGDETQVLMKKQPVEQIDTIFLEHFFTYVPKMLKEHLLVNRFKYYTEREVCMNIEHKLAKLLMENYHRIDKGRLSKFIQDVKGAYFLYSGEEKLQRQLISMLTDAGIDVC